MRQSQHAARGFTLIELLVVIIIIGGILVGFITLSLSPGGPDRQVQREAQRLIALLQQASEEAVLTAQEIGVRFDDNSYSFSFLSGDVWLAFDGDELLRQRELPPGMRIDLWLDGLKVSFSAEDDDQAPQVFLLSSGETTAFDLRIQDEDSRIGYRLQGDPFGRIKLVTEANL